MRNITVQIICALMRAPQSRSDLAKTADASLQSVDRLLAELHDKGATYIHALDRRGATGRLTRLWAMNQTPFGNPDATV